MSSRSWLRPSKKIKIILIAVLSTLLCTLLIFNFRNPQKELRYHIEASAPVDSPFFLRVLSNLMGPPFTTGNQVQSLYNGDEIFPAMLKAIASAQKTITFESYIYWSGTIGDKFADALIERAQHGVRVHVMIDWVGSQKIKDSLIERMRAAGIEVEKYHALRWYNVSRLNYRTHRKILVIDGKIGFTGGVGIADEWSGNGQMADKWRDTHFQVVGPVVSQMQAAFMDNWLKTRPEIHNSADYFPELKPHGSSYAQMFLSSSQEGGSSVRIMYLLAIAAAQKSIHIESAYFIPDEATLEEILKARKRGVQVKLILPGPLVDSVIVRHASRGQWEPLFEAGVEIYEYQPALFHCKVFIVDGKFVSIGSTNFDERSFRLNDEANLNVVDEKFASLELQAFEKDLKLSKPVSHEAWLHRPLVDKFIEKFLVLFRSQF